MNIHIEVISHSDQRLGQPGDWFFLDDETEKYAQNHEIEFGDLVVRVSDLGDWRLNFLLGRHEMDEAMLCKHAGITAKMVDEGDAELDRKGARNDPDSFSGYPGSCYQDQHNDALASEWQMSRLLGVKWNDYSVTFEPLWGSRKK